MISDIFYHMVRKYMSPGDSNAILNMAVRVYDERAAYRIVAMNRIRRKILLVGKFAIAFKELYNEVAFRPWHSGAKRARESYEAAASEHDRRRRRLK